ncbi:hypothetical protein A3768_0527 [Ralstonia solanacearum]|nr:hypothetical protein A3768_0527 [Ralstonia solanacearum]
MLARSVFMQQVVWQGGGCPGVALGSGMRGATQHSAAFENNLDKVCE